MDTPVWIIEQIGDCGDDDINVIMVCSSEEMAEEYAEKWRNEENQFWKGKPLYSYCVTMFVLDRLPEDDTCAT